VFAPAPSGRGYFLPLYTTRRADLATRKYAYWKTEEIAPKIPDLKDSATHQLAVDAFKFDKARALAEKRAKDLAAIMEKGKADIPGALSGQTINGAQESPAVVVRESPKFTWLRQQHSFPMMGPSMPMVSNIDIIDQAGSAFLKTVFEDMANGSFGVALNQPRTVYYALHVHDREGEGNDGGVELQQLQAKFMKEEFSSYLPSPYDFFGVQEQQLFESRWRLNFMMRYGIKFDNSVLTNGNNDGE
jgi:hypothetical protein